MNNDNNSENDSNKSRENRSMLAACSQTSYECGEVGESWWRQRIAVYESCSKTTNKNISFFRSLVSASFGCLFMLCNSTYVSRLVGNSELRYSYSFNGCFVELWIILLIGVGIYQWTKTLLITLQLTAARSVTMYRMEIHVRNANECVAIVAWPMERLSST